MISSFGRYLPGKLWSLASMTVLTGQENSISYLKTSYLVLYNFLLANIYTVTIGFIWALWLGIIQRSILNISLFILFFVFSIFILHSKHFNLLYIILKKLRKGTHSDFQIPIGRFIELSLMTISGLLISGLSLPFILLSFHQTDIVTFFKAVGVYPLAFFCGYLAFFVPAGIGIQESVVYEMLKYLHPKDLVLSAAFVSRFCLIVTQVVLLFLSLAMRKRFHDR
jgi:hypothetical protein